MTGTVQYSTVQYSTVQHSTVQVVYDRFGKERRFRAKKKRRRHPQHGRPVPQVGDDQDVDAEVSSLEFF